jgi:acetylornithine deacetylase/succinyl-diaminopimelate desuccinylase-like protein
VLCAFTLPAQETVSLGDRAAGYLADLIRLDTTNPPGNETHVAEYLKRIADQYEIPAELLGDDPARLNFVARLRGDGPARPLLLMAHSDVVPAERAQWTVDPFAGETRDGEIYGRGAQDDKNLLAAELAILVELKLRGIKLNRDIILLAESDEESGSTGVQWMIANAFASIDAEVALNEGGAAQDLRSGVRLFQIQTAEKIPTRIVLTARGTAGHASLPRSDNAIVHLARALVRLENDQPVRLNQTTRRYFARIAALPDYRWLAPLPETRELLDRLLSRRPDPCARARTRRPAPNHDLAHNAERRFEDQRHPEHRRSERGRAPPAERVR